MPASRFWDAIKYGQTDEEAQEVWEFLTEFSEGTIVDNEKHDDDYTDVQEFIMFLEDMQQAHDVTASEGILLTLSGRHHKTNGTIKSAYNAVAKVWNLN